MQILVFERRNFQRIWSLKVQYPLLVYSLLRDIVQSNNMLVRKNDFLIGIIATELSQLLQNLKIKQIKLTFEEFD